MRIIFCLMVFLFIGKNTMLAQQLSSFVEYGAALHTGDNTPLWQVSNQQGLTSLDNNTYIRGGISYKHQLGKWKFEEALDLVAAAGFSTTSFIVQQAYVDIRYKWFGFFAGSREQNSPLLNQELSSGGMTWSGNARPIPQVQIGIPEYVQLLPRLGLKGEISYGWFTDNKYQREQVGEKYWYTKSIKYHHKEGFLRDFRNKFRIGNLSILTHNNHRTSQQATQWPVCHTYTIVFIKIRETEVRQRNYVFNTFCGAETGMCKRQVF